ncbi:MAG: hypothetical protein GXP22_08125 [Gammaproteobacteria bacterium]|nr:hypothetical protein [Gammaproteobacteria bacterium]
MSVYSIDKLMSEARNLAASYRKMMGKPLPGISGEIAEHDAARLLNLELCNPKPGGYDAIGRGKREGKHIQIKGRAIFDEKKGGQRIGQIKVEQKWDSIVLVLMDDDFETFEIYEAQRNDIIFTLNEDEGSSRKRRGAMSVARFKKISRLVWIRGEGEVEDDEVWSNQAD